MNKAKINKNALYTRFWLEWTESLTSELSMCSRLASKIIKVQTQRIESTYKAKKEFFNSKEKEVKKKEKKLKEEDQDDLEDLR